MAANETTITVSTRIGEAEPTLTPGFPLPSASTEAMLQHTAEEIKTELNNKNAGIFHSIDGLGIVLHFKAEDNTHYLFAGERKTKVGATFGGKLDNKNLNTPIIEQIATELDEESHHQLRFAKDEQGKFRQNEKGQFIILCTRGDTTRELTLEFNTVPNHFVDNRKSERFNMAFFTVQGVVAGLTKEELLQMAAERTPTAKLWHTIYGELVKLGPPRPPRKEGWNWQEHWDSKKDAREGAKAAIRNCYESLKAQHGEFLVDPIKEFKKGDMEGTLSAIFDEVPTEKDYWHLRDENIGRYSESPNVAVVPSSSISQLGKSETGKGVLIDVTGNPVVDTDGKPVTSGFMGFAIKQLIFPADLPAPQPKPAVAVGYGPGSPRQFSLPVPKAATTEPSATSQLTR